MTAGEDVLTIDATAKTCRGAIAQLEEQFGRRPFAGLVRIRIESVPNRIDVIAWAGRRGHRIVREERHGEQFELLIAKGERPTSPHARPVPWRPG